MSSYQRFLLVCALTLVACGDSAKMLGPNLDAGTSGDGDAPVGDGDAPVGDGDAPVGDGDAPVGDGDAPVGDGDAPVGDGDGDAPVGDGDGDGDGGTPETPWYACQSSDQAFVRNALMAVLGRRPYSQAEVQAYADLIGQIDAIDHVTDETNPPGSKLRRSRKALLDILFKDSGYAKYWAELYRDFIKVQRADEQYNGPCFAEPMNANPVAVAATIRSKPASSDGGGTGTFTMYDVVQGSLALDDVTPIYDANIFAMLTLTYLGANATPVALELTRRRDFGAWFEGVYLHRDTVCLNCHNSEFSVTQTNNPLTNRHFPINALLEKSLFGESTGPVTFGGYEGGDRSHAPLRYRDFVNDCGTRTQTQAQANVKCADPNELVVRCLNERICASEVAKRQARPWGWAAACGKYKEEKYVTIDLAGVQAKFGNLTGLRTSPWGLAESLRTGFAKLKKEGLGADEAGEVADPDKAFAYLTAMNIVEKVWIQIVGTPLTIPTRFPRNAAARDQLQHLTEEFIKSGFSNRKLVETVLASPYFNVPAPSEGCGAKPYALPAIFDPWVIAETDAAKRKNSAADGIVSLPSRTAASLVYSAMGWTPIAPNSTFPDTFNVDPEDPIFPIIDAERTFQSETGHYLKNSEPGFRGFDFQARLGWEDRFAVCSKLDPAATDYIDLLLAQVTAPGKATVADLVIALKDRLVGRTSIEPLAEKPALESLLGATLDTDAKSLLDAQAGLRKVCGVIVSSPQFLLGGLAPEDASEAPKLTLPSASYFTTCSKIEAAVTGAFSVDCASEGPLTVSAR
ncbi:MAG: hypothetical protein QM778_18920 [Myxococcales bacterium]